jgi:phosphatidylglycerol---prolipoprotein diacylglyceryl transferase
MVFSILLPTFDPVMLSLGPLQFRWYGMVYMVTPLIWWAFARRTVAKHPYGITPLQIDDSVIYVLLGIALGGRLGHILFYAPLEHLSHPLEIFKVWKGGMSFHGGIIGILVAMYLYARKAQVSYLKLIDLIAVIGPLASFFGRIANFINQELYGRVTDVPWAMIFPYSDGQPRHPSQLYEAFTEGFLLFLLTTWLWSNPQWRDCPGRISGFFFLSYGLARSFCECFREIDMYMPFIDPLTWGQILCLPMMMLGWFLIRRPHFSPSHP